MYYLLTCICGVIVLDVSKDCNTLVLRVKLSKNVFLPLLGPGDEGTTILRNVGIYNPNQSALKYQKT
jgi:hypothetical protein